METNPLLAHRVIPLRERVEKTIVAVVVYASVLGGLYWYHGEIPERFSREFFIAAGVSIFLFSYVILSMFKHERATDKQRVRMIRMRIDDDRSGRHWTSRIGLHVQLSIGRVVMLVGIAMILFGLYVFGKQVYVWATAKAWVPASTLQYIRPYIDWLFTKDIWIAGQKAVIWLLHRVHVSVPLGLLGALLAAQGARFMEWAREKALTERRAGSAP